MTRKPLMQEDSSSAKVLERIAAALERLAGLQALAGQLGKAVE